MPIDFEKPPHVLVVHGVQISEDRKIRSDTQIRALIARSLSDAHLERDFSVYDYF